jgi:twitching motility protein PilI
VSNAALSKPDKELALRDYQRDLLTRTQSAQRSNSVSQKRLAFSAGGYRWLIQMEDAIEIMPMPAVVAVPGTLDWFKGLMNYRGRLVSVIDFNRLLAGPANSHNQTDRLIILSDRLSAPCALQVADLRGLLDLNYLQPKSRSIANHPWLGARYVIDDVDWYELNLTQMVSDPVFLKAYAE